MNWKLLVIAFSILALIAPAFFLSLMGLFAVQYAIFYFVKESSAQFIVQFSTIYFWCVIVERMNLL